MNENFVSRQQVSLLSERILKAEETNATKELYSHLWQLYEKKHFKPLNVMVVGAGGSYSSALIAAHSIRDKMCTSSVEVATPQTALRIIKQFDNIVNCTWHPEYDIVIGISYSGKTPDIRAVYETCMGRRSPFPFVLLTGVDKAEMRGFYCESEMLKIVSYFNAEDDSGKERGMISMFSTLAPAVIFDDYSISDYSPKHYSKVYGVYLKEGEKFVSELDVSEIATAIKEHPVVHVFYEWETLPTAADIESKFVESGIANVVFHEKKNFSHGRYTALYNMDFAVVINLTKYVIEVSTDTTGAELKKTYRNDYDERIAQFLRERCASKSAYYLEMGNGKFGPTQWNLEEMSKLPYLITAIGEKLDIDISKPLTPFPKETTALYDYRDVF